MPPRTTRRAFTHVTLVRRADPERAATWRDVAAAFDAGLHFGVNQRQVARRELTERDAGAGRLYDLVLKDAKRG